MAGSMRIVFHHEAFDAYRRSPEIAAELSRRAHLVAEAAGGEPDFAVIDEVTNSRARSTVITASTAGMEAEATGQVLTKALDAGRG
jgi:hypothetical protein